jgi:hypothetical protein
VVVVVVLLLSTTAHASTTLRGAAPTVAALKGREQQGGWHQLLPAAETQLLVVTAYHMGVKAGRGGKVDRVLATLTQVGVKIDATTPHQEHTNSTAMPSGLQSGLPAAPRHIKWSQGQATAGR